MLFFDQSQPWIYEANKLYFYPSAGGLKTKNKKTTTARLIRTCDTCSHTYSYILYVYIMIELQHYAVLLHVVGTQEEIQYYIL